MQGPGYEVSKTLGANLKFTGKSMQVQDPSLFYVTLEIDGKKELYTFDTPKVNLCNLIIGEMYIEPAGNCVVKNHTTGDVCELEFKARGWTAKSRDIVNGEVKDKKGAKKFTISGKFSETISVKNLETGESQDLF